MLHIIISGPGKRNSKVIVLARVNTGKMGNRWLGPGTVVRVKSPYSYLVDLGNGNVRHLHANKMRHFIARVQVLLLSVTQNLVSVVTRICM